MSVFLFRIDYTSKYIKNEIEKGFLRQGWGTEGLNLIDKNGLITHYDNWVQNYPWENDESKKRSKYNNLLNMLNMEIGDFIVVPKFPEWINFTIFKVNRKYNYNLNNEVKDYGHIIGVDYENKKTFHYQANDESKLIHSKLRAYQSAINNILNEDVKNTVESLFFKESDMEAQDIAQIIKNSFFKNFNEFNYKLNSLNPYDIEKLVELIFTAAGYKLEDKNHYDREGGDADLVFSKNFEIISDFLDDKNLYQLYIQVKKKLGKDSNEFEGIEQLEKITSTIDSENTFYSKILVSTSTFSEKVQREAKRKNIILIDGKELVKLIIKYL